MNTLYKKILTYKGENFKHCFQLLGMLEIFEPIFEHYPTDVHEPAAMYIINAYSQDSPLIYSGGNWSDIKKTCAKAAALPQEYWDNFIFFGGEDIGPEQGDMFVDDFDNDLKEDALGPVKNEKKEEQLTIIKEQILNDRIVAIIDVVAAYLEFQASRDHRHLLRMYDLYEELMDASVSRLKKGARDMTMDYKAKRECMKEATDLLDEIKLFESKLKDEDIGLQSAKEEVKKKLNIKKQFRPEVIS